MQVNNETKQNIDATNQTLKPKRSTEIKVSNLNLSREELERIFETQIPAAKLVSLPQSERLDLKSASGKKNFLTQSIESFFNFLDRNIIQRINKLIFPKEAQKQTQQENLKEQIQDTEFKSAEDKKLASKLEARLNDKNLNITNEAREKLEIALNNAIENKAVNYNDLPDCCKPENISKEAVDEISSEVNKYQSTKTKENKSSNKSSYTEYSEDTNTSSDNTKPKASLQFASKLQEQYHGYVSSKHPDKLAFFEEEILRRHGSQLAKYQDEEAALAVMSKGLAHLKLSTGKDITKDTTTTTQYRRYIDGILNQDVDPHYPVNAIQSDGIQDMEAMAKDKEQVKKAFHNLDQVSNRNQQEKLAAKDILKQIKSQNPDFKIKDPVKTMADIKEAIENGKAEEYIASHTIIETEVTDLKDSQELHLPDNECKDTLHSL